MTPASTLRPTWIAWAAICGFAKRATKENGGLTLVHAAKHPLTDYPKDWKDQLEVINHKRKRSRLKGAADCGRGGPNREREP